MKVQLTVFTAALAACVSLAQPGREITVSQVSDAELSVGLAPSGSEGTLWVAFGASDGGDTTNGWANVQRVADVPAAACEVPYAMPSDWKTSDVRYRFFVFSDETDRYSSYLVESVTSSGDLHVDTGVLIDGTTMLETRVRLVMTPMDTLWPVCGIANPEPYFFLGRGEGGRIFYGGGIAENVDCGVYVDLNHKMSFDLDFREGTYQVFDLETDPPTEKLNATNIKRQNTSGANTFWLFGYNGEQAQRKMAIYSAEMWQFGTLVADMAPAVSNGVACLWDNVRQKYLLPVDKVGNLMNLTPSAVRCAPDVSSTETFSSQEAGGPQLVNVSVVTTDGRPVLQGRIVRCGIGYSTCSVIVKYGQGTETPALVRTAGTDVSAGAVSVPLDFLAPERSYPVVLRIENGNGEFDESDVLAVTTPPAKTDASGSRAIFVKSMDLSAGKAVLSVEAGVAGTLTVLAGNVVAGSDPSVWPFVGEGLAVDEREQEIEVTLPVDSSGNAYRVVQFVLASPRSTVYSHLVDAMTSVTESRYVDTGVVITPQNYMTSRMRITFKLTESGKWNVNGFSAGNGAGRYFVGVSSEGWLSYGLGGRQEGDIPYSYGNVVTMDLDARDMTCTAYDETAGRMVKEWTMINSAPTGNMPLWIHGWNEGCRRQVIYRAQYWQGEDLICDLMPCVDLDGTGCYYDAAADRLVYSTGSGTELQPGATVKEQTGRLVCLPDSVGAPRLVRMEVTDGDVRGNTVTISGAVAQEGAESVTSVELSVVLTRGGESEVRVLGNPNADGRFAFDVTGLEPGERYDWQLTACSSGGSDTELGAAFATRKATYLQSATVRSEQYRVIGDVYASFGPGATDLWVEWTVSETETNRLALGTFTALDDPHQAFEVNLRGVADDSPFAYRVVASNDLGEVYALSTISGSLRILDQATYTWKPGVSGRWTDPESWTCDKADRWDYPNGDHCGVVFGGAADVEIDGVVRAARLSFADDEELDVRFHAANTNDYSFTYVLDDELEIPDGGRVTVDGACVNWEEPLTNTYAFALGEAASLVVTNGAHFTTRYLKAYEEGSRIVICDGASVGVQDFSLGNGEMVLDDAFAECQALFVNNEIDRHDNARLLIRGKNPQLRWRLYDARTKALVAANASVCRMGRIDFEIPSGGYATTPVLCLAAYEEYPFADCENLRGFSGRTANLTVRVVNARVDYASFPKHQPLVEWSSGIQKSHVDLVQPAYRHARFDYSDETDRPTSLELFTDRSIGMMIFVQ